MNIQKMILIPKEKYQRLQTERNEGHKHDAPTQSIVEQDSDDHDDDDTDTTPSLTREDITQTLPKLFRAKATALLRHIENSDIMTWNARGEVAIHGKVIENSHISDLVKDAMKMYKNFNPIGKAEFYNALYNSNVPIGLLENVDRRNEIQSRKHSIQPSIPKSIRGTLKKRRKKRVLPKTWIKL